MGHRRLAASAAAAILILLVGCTPEPAPRPTTAPSATGSATPTPTPTVDAFATPEAAFDVTCDDVASALASIIGEPSTPVLPALSTVSTMGWIPGPPQYMFQRAGGIACSAGADPRYWEVYIVPDAQKVIAGATERGGYWGEQGRCEQSGYCGFEFPVGDVLLSATIFDPDLGTADMERVGAVLRTLAGEAADSVHAVEYIDSVLVGVRCERLVTEQELSTYFGAEARLFSDYGGWSIPSEVYEVVNGSRHCLYISPEGGYDAAPYLGITMLPAGAWAFADQQGTPAEVEGADAAVQSVGEHGENHLDVQVGGDWLRFTTYPDGDGGGAVDPALLAARIVRNLTVGHLAPQ